MRLITLHALGLHTPGIKIENQFFTLGRSSGIKTRIQMLGTCPETTETVYNAIYGGNPKVLRKSNVGSIDNRIGLLVKATSRDEEWSAIQGAFKSHNNVTNETIFERCLQGIQVLASGCGSNGAEYLLLMKPGTQFSIHRYFCKDPKRQDLIVVYKDDDIAIYTVEGYLNRESNTIRHSTERK